MKSSVGLFGLSECELSAHYCQGGVAGSNRLSRSICHVSGHAGHMSHDIVDSMGLSEALVVVGRVEDQLADEQAVVADDADVEVGDEEPNNLAFVGPSDPDTVSGSSLPLQSAGLPGRRR